MAICADVELVLSLLVPYLPYSLPLYRRIQFQSAHPTSPDARILTSPPASQISNSSFPDSVPAFTVGHFDLTRGPETQIWLFSTIEHPSSGHSSAEFVYLVRNQLTDILRSCYKELVPRLPVVTPLAYTANEKAQKRYGKVAYSPSRVLIGTLHRALRELIPADIVRRVDAPYLKYIFREEGARYRGCGNGEADALPAGYAYGPLDESHFQLVLDRTDIPRSADTLKMLYGRGVFVDGEEKVPIAWGFLGLDGSLSSLHTEMEHRGKGLGVKLSRHLFGSQGAVFKDHTEWAHADVADENARSRRVMEKVGGAVMWKNGWVEVELKDWLEEEETTVER